MSKLKISAAHVVMGILTIALVLPVAQNLQAQTSNPPAIDTQNWSNVVWEDANIGGWAQTANLNGMTISGRTISLPYDKSGIPDTCEPTTTPWPCGYPFGLDPTRADQGGTVGTAMIFAYLTDNKWHAATFDFLRVGQTSKDTSNITDGFYCGGGSLRGALSNFTPTAGTRYGFMVSGIARSGYENNIAERSNLVMQTWTGDTGLSSPDACGGDAGTGTDTGTSDTDPISPESPLPFISTLSSSTINQGSQLVVYGQKLGPSLQFINSANATFTYAGTVNAAKTSVSLVIPSVLPVGSYQVQDYVSANLISNKKNITIAGAVNNPVLDCDNLPENADPSDIYNCSLEDILSEDGQVYAPGEDPTSPVELPLSGTYGMDGAYASKSSKMLIVANNVTTADISIQGVIVNPETFTVEAGPFVIDQGGATAFAGSPQVSYSEADDVFLVAWEDERSGDNRRRDTYARMVKPDGSMPNNDFPVNLGAAFFNDLDYDPVSNKFVFIFEEGGLRNYIKTADLNGNVGNSIDVPRLVEPGYEGQSNLAVNVNLKQYWVSMLACGSPDGATTEDCKVALYRMDISNGTWIGQPVILTKPNIGKNRFGGSEIAYSPVDRATAFVWLERVRPEGPGEWGRTMYDDGTLGEEYEVITPSSFPYSDAYGAPAMNYNPWTNTVFISTEDNEGGSILIEMTIEGLILNIRQAIAPPNSAVERGLLQKFVRLFVNEAQAEAYGTFWPNNFTTPTGAIALGSQGFARVVMTSTPSLYADLSTTSGGETPVPPTTPTPADTSSLPKLINQVYKWSLGIAALLALLMVILGGYNYMTSAGNAEQASKGTEMIWGAIIGLILLFASYLILSTINPDLVNFNIDSANDLTNPQNQQSNQ